ncbi:MAG: hypothetical protein IIV67_07315, partial [Bacteroidaceae bacterium]|nr:hypothetical protein [Bacteroidaceae bacterium]
MALTNLLPTNPEAPVTKTFSIVTHSNLFRKNLSQCSYQAYSAGTAGASSPSGALSMSSMN